MTDSPQCAICGADAVTVFGYDPLCANGACKQALVDRISGEVQVFENDEEAERFLASIEGELD